jgi:hypothetical protein
MPGLDGIKATRRIAPTQSRPRESFLNREVHGVHDFYAGEAISQIMSS